MQLVLVNHGVVPVNVERPPIWCVLLLAVTAFSGCPNRTGPTLPKLEIVASDNPAAEADLRGARAAEARGEWDEARQRYAAFIETWPQDPTVPVALLSLGKLALQRGDLEQARGYFERAAQSPDVAISERARMYGAIADQQGGRHHDALARLQPLVGRTVDPVETALVLSTIADAQKALGDRLASLETRDKMLEGELPAGQREATSAEVRRLVDELEADTELGRAYEILPREGYAWTWVGYRWLRVNHERSQTDAVLSISEDMAEQGVALSDELRALVLRAERSTLVDRGVVGAILPLSGRGREVGQSALRGLMIAAGLPREGPPDENTPRIEFRDDEGKPELARKAVEDLVSLHRVVAIVGPIASTSTRAAAERAAELGVPMITLSPAQSPEEGESRVFRLHPTAAEEVGALVAHASSEGARRFALLHPQGGYGEAMRAAYEVAVEVAGGEVVLATGYAPGQTSFGTEVKTLSDTEFDALLVSDSARRVALIAPALAAAGMWTTLPDQQPPDGRRIELLLPSAAFSPSLARTSKRYLQGAIFAAPFDPARGEGQRFAEAYREQFDAEPTTFSAFAHDAYALVQATLLGGAQTRDAVAEALPSARARLISGVGGLNDSGGPNRAGRLYTLTGETFAPVFR